MSAWRYPASYGPRSPSFARAARCPAAIGEALLLSGTASILGHETVHVGDTVGQLAETMRNIDALVARPDLPPRPLDHLKVFLRCRGDLARVDAALRATVGPALPLLYLEADICRRDLLIEIEGLAG